VALRVAPVTGPAWKRIATVMDTVSAEVIRRLLASEGVPAEIRSDSSLLGEARQCDILVPAAWAARAQAILGQHPASDAELERLAGGCDPPTPDEGSRNA